MRAEVSEKEGVDGRKKEEREQRTWTQAGFRRLMSRDMQDRRIKQATKIRTDERWPGGGSPVPKEAVTGASLTTFLLDGMTAPFEPGEKQIRMPAKGSHTGVVGPQTVDWPHRGEATRTAERRDNKKAGTELMRPWLH